MLGSGRQRVLTRSLLGVSAAIAASLTQWPVAGLRVYEALMLLVVTRVTPYGTSR